jgi:hypothetical protein
MRASNIIPLALVFAFLAASAFSALTQEQIPDCISATCPR